MSKVDGSALLLTLLLLLIAHKIGNLGLNAAQQNVEKINGGEQLSILCRSTCISEQVMKLQKNLVPVKLETLLTRVQKNESQKKLILLVTRCYTPTNLNYNLLILSMAV